MVSKINLSNWKKLEENNWQKHTFYELKEK